MTLPRSDHFNGKTFFQHHHATLRLRDFWKWRLTHKPKPWPGKVATAAPLPPPLPRDNEVVATWIGHATFLLQTAQNRILIDPVFSERASPVAWAGPRRVHPPGIALDALPRIDAVLLSHDHYDHCDATSLAAIARKHPAVFIAPLRHRDLLARLGARQIVELDWWEAHPVNVGLRVTLTPSQHWSNRFGSPRNFRLWGGFFLQFGEAAASAAGADHPAHPKRVWFVGDTGYAPEIFAEVRRRCGAPDLALVPIGAYEPRWFMQPMHINPAEAVQLHREVGARLSVGMHWGTFQLTDESRDDPVVALAEARRAVGIASEDFRVVGPGESVVV